MSDKKQSVGAIWKKQTSKGEILSITIDGKRYVAWPNNRKTESKHPDYNILLDDYKPQAKQEQTHVPKSVVKDDTDLPF